MAGHQLVFLSLLFCYSMATEGNPEQQGNNTRFPVVTFHWESIETPYMITTWLVLAAVAKILFHVFKPIANAFPDSSLLIVVGLGGEALMVTSLAAYNHLVHKVRLLKVVGYLLQSFGANVNLTLDSHVFFVYLLPPIIFDAGYFMPNRALFENLDSVLLFSVVGTIWNAMAIGVSLLLFSYLDMFSMAFSTFEIFLFSSLIAAVDPVAVIAVFEECHVNDFLFVHVFGEALFNDGVAVVLYQMAMSFTIVGPENVKAVDYGAGALSFLVATLGGTATGLAFAFATSLATKYTNSVRILAPVFIFVLPYMAYLTAEMTSMSSIIAISVCGMAMKQYVKGNISQAAANSVKYFTKMLAQSTETVIFMFLGLSTIGSEQYWDTCFVLATIICCLLWRTVGVLAQCWILNKFRHKKFTKIDQFVLSYGGLRGAIAFGLIVSIPSSIEAKPMFITTTIAVIYFTVFLQGITIRPLVQFLNIETKDQRPATMAESVYNKYLDYLMSGLEDITGQKGHYSFRDTFERFNAKVLRPVLLRNQEKGNFDASSIVRAYAKITLEDALNLTKQHKLEHKQVVTLRVPELGYSPRGLGSALPVAVQPPITLTLIEKQLDMFISSGENLDQLCTMFSDLLDRKLRELDAPRECSNRRDADDIHDDYMQ